jgi:hypothetical protein
MNTGDAEVISKTIDEIVEPDALIRTPLPLGTTGAQKLKDVFARLHQVYADLQVTIEEMIAEGDKVVSRNSVTGTHQGAYMGGDDLQPARDDPAAQRADRQGPPDPQQHARRLTSPRCTRDLSRMWTELATCPR